jgi:hypothetical protein
MARPLTLPQIIAAYTKWHVRFVVYGGAATRGRPGGITDAHGELEHHTGGGSASASYLYFLFVTGRPAEGIPGPLCNEATDSGGTVHVGAVGRANHAGMGSSTTRDRVVGESYNGYSAELRPGPDGINGNPIYYGNEWIYSGTKPPTAAQYRGAVLAAAARADAHGWSALSFVAHREHTGRKNDPFGVSMPEFRRAVRTVLAAGPKATVNYVATGKLAVPVPPTDTKPTTPVGDDMAWTEAQLRAMMQAENEEYAIRFWIDSTGTGTALRNMISKMNLQLDRIEADTDRAAAAGLTLDADGMLPASRELVTALDKSINDLANRPAASELQAFLNADGTTDPVDHP